MQAKSDRGKVRYAHLIDLLVNGKGAKIHHIQEASQPTYEFDIEEILAENTNILPQLAEANGLEGIKAACMHHVKHVSFSGRTDFKLSYLPIKTAI